MTMQTDTDLGMAGRVSIDPSTWEIREGDCVALMAAMPESSADAIVCDPPYGLEFMGRKWDRLGAAVEDFREGLDDEGNVDYHGKGNAPFGGGGKRVRYGASAKSMQAWHETWAREALRVLKPGGHLLAFGGTRTYHRLVCAIEDAGFEIRDTIAWMYGSGFPKSLDVSKAIDRAVGAERAVVGFADNGATVPAPATPEAEHWQGWGTALKPAHEPIVVARKSLVGTVAANVVAYGTGAINIDGCRIGEGGHLKWSTPRDMGYHGGIDTGGIATESASGRWPANVVLDEQAAAMLDEQTGELVSGGGPFRRSADKFGRNAYGKFKGTDEVLPPGDSGGASRFYYCAKASSAERAAGLGDMPDGERRTYGDSGPGHDSPNGQTATRAANHHPTVKPISLMRWLVRLVTPPGGVVLDPFAGSGTTGCAAVLEGFDFIGLEREADYAEIARARIAFWATRPGAETAAVLRSVAAERVRPRVARPRSGVGSGADS